MQVKDHGNWGHGLRPGQTHDLNCDACKREQAESTSGEQLIAILGRVPNHAPDVD